MTPMLLPKLRSRRLLDEIARMPFCTLRVAGLAGQRCAPTATHVAAHIATYGKGMSTKTSDLAAVCACATCHDLLDRRAGRWQALYAEHEAEVWRRIARALTETHGWLAGRGLLTVPGGKIL